MSTCTGGCATGSRDTNLACVDLADKAKCDRAKPAILNVGEDLDDPLVNDPLDDPTADVLDDTLDDEDLDDEDLDDEDLDDEDLDEEDTPDAEKDGSPMGIILIIVGLLVSIVVAILVYCYCCAKKSDVDDNYNKVNA